MSAQDKNALMNKSMRNLNPAVSLNRRKVHAKNFKGTLKRLLVYLAPYKLKLGLVLVMVLFSSLFSVLSPKIMGDITTIIAEGIQQKAKHLPNAKIDFASIQKIILVLAGLFFISALFSYFQQSIMVRLTQNIVSNMRKAFHQKLARLPLNFFDSHPHGETLSLITNDVDTIAISLQQSLSQLLSSVIGIIGVLTIMLVISPLLTLITLAAIPIYLFVIKSLAQRSQKHFALQRRFLGEINGYVEQTYAGHTIMKAYGQEKETQEQFDQVNGKLYDSGWRAQFVSGFMMPMMDFINNVVFILVCMIGGIFFIKQSIKIGDLQAFIQYSKQFTRPLSQISNSINSFQSSIASAERIFELLDETEEIEDTKYPATIKSPRGEVEFQNVSFGYEQGNKAADQIDIHVHPGDTVAIVGSSGAGKTTLMHLLMRFYELNQGRILIDGVDIRDLKREDLRGMFGMVLQDTWLFNGTIRENIAYGQKEVSFEDVVRASTIAHADHFIRTLPEGYETILNEDISNISYGQKQLLTIARGVLSNPSLLILDEATSNVDTRTETLIQQAMKSLMKGKTSFIVAHRLSTIRHANLILVMDKGTIVEKGNHIELLAKGGYYSELYRSQFLQTPYQAQIVSSCSFQ